MVNVIKKKISEINMGIEDLDMKIDEDLELK